MQGVILAAGKGTRLRPITATRTKAMVPIAGKPIVERVMDHLVSGGINDLILIISPDDDPIRHYFERESRIEARVRFAPQAERLGMAHAVACAAPLVDGPFMLSACDSLISAGHVNRMVAAWHGQPQPNGLLSLLPVEPERLGAVGIVEMDGPWVTRIIEKPPPEEAPSNISSLPLYCFAQRIIDYLPEVPLSPRGEYELQDAIQMLIERDGHVGGVMARKRLTLTRPTDLLALNRHYLATEGGRVEAAPGEMGPGSQLIAPVHIERGAIIGRDCVLGPNVYVETGSHVGDGARLKNAAILRGAKVPSGAHIQDDIIA
jgi:NDP-sugar pyrophosphorylase family protein